MQCDWFSQSLLFFAYNEMHVTFEVWIEHLWQGQLQFIHKLSFAFIIRNVLVFRSLNREMISN